MIIHTALVALYLKFDKGDSLCREHHHKLCGILWKSHVDTKSKTTVSGPD